MYTILLHMLCLYVYHIITHVMSDDLHVVLLQVADKMSRSRTLGRENGSGVDQGQSRRDQQAYINVTPLADRMVAGLDHQAPLAAPQTPLGQVRTQGHVLSMDSPAFLQCAYQQMCLKQGPQPPQNTSDITNNNQSQMAVHDLYSVGSRLHDARLHSVSSTPVPVSPHTTIPGQQPRLLPLGDSALPAPSNHHQLPQGTYRVGPDGASSIGFSSGTASNNHVRTNDRNSIGANTGSVSSMGVASTVSSMTVSSGEGGPCLPLALVGADSTRVTWSTQHQQLLRRTPRVTGQGSSQLAIIQPQQVTSLPYTPQQVTSLPYTPQQVTSLPYTPQQVTSLPYTPGELQRTDQFPQRTDAFLPRPSPEEYSRCTLTRMTQPNLGQTALPSPGPGGLSAKTQELTGSQQRTGTVSMPVVGFHGYPSNVTAPDHCSGITCGTGIDYGRIELPRAQQQNPSVQQQNSSVQQQNSSVQQQNSSVQQQNPSIQQQNPSVQQQNPSIQQQNPSVPQQNPSVQQQNPSIQQQNPSVQQQNPSVPHQNPSVQQQNLSVQQQNSARNMQQMLASVYQQNPSIRRQISSIQQQNPSLQQQNPRTQQQNTNVLQHSQSIRPQISKIQEKNPNILQQISNILPQKSNILPQSPNILPQSPNILPQNPNILPQNPNILPQNPSIVPQNPNILPQNPSIVPQNPNILPQNPNIVPQNRSAQQQNPNILPQNPNILPQNPSIQQSDFFVGQKPSVQESNFNREHQNPTTQQQSSVLLNYPSVQQQNSSLQEQNLALAQQVRQLQKLITHSPTQQNTASTQQNTAPTQQNTAPTQQNTAPTQHLTAPTQQNIATTQQNIATTQQLTSPRLLTAEQLTIVKQGVSRLHQRLASLTAQLNSQTLAAQPDQITTGIPDNSVANIKPIAHRMNISPNTDIQETVRAGEGASQKMPLSHTYTTCETHANSATCTTSYTTSVNMNEEGSVSRQPTSIKVAHTTNQTGNSSKGCTTHSEGNTTPSGGNTTHSQANTTPIEGYTTSIESNTTATEGNTTAAPTWDVIEISDDSDNDDDVHVTPQAAEELTYDNRGDEHTANALHTTEKSVNDKTANANEDSYMVLSQIELTQSMRVAEHKCDKCNETFTNASGLQKHKRDCGMMRTGVADTPASEEAIGDETSEDEVEKFICDTCYKCFRDRRLWMRHRQKHAKETDGGKIGKRRTNWELDAKSVQAKKAKFSIDYGNNRTGNVNAPPDHSPKTGYACTKCGSTFEDAESRREHVFACRENSFLCKKCMLGFSTKEEHNEHISSGHGRKGETGRREVNHNEPYPACFNHSCKICSRCFARKNMLTNHNNVHQKGKKYSKGTRIWTCHPCKAYFTLDNNYRHHRNSFHSATEARRSLKVETERRCKSDSEAEDGTTNSRYSPEAEAEESGLTSVSSMETSSISPYKKQKSKIPQIVKCAKCFKNLQNRKIHQHMVACNGECFACLRCKQSFTDKEALVQHEQTRRGDPCTARRGKNKGLVCKICGRKFNKRHGLLRHQASHESRTTRGKYKEYQCKMCQCYFPDGRDHRNHVLYYHASTKRQVKDGIKCRICSKICVGVHGLARHRATHKTGAVLNWTKSNLNSQANSRIVPNRKNFKPFVCKGCNSGFDTKEDIDEHVCERQKPSRGSSKSDKRNKWVCKVCQRWFRSSKALEVHGICHKQREYDDLMHCPACRLYIRGQRGLERHMSLFHRPSSNATNHPRNENIETSEDDSDKDCDTDPYSVESDNSLDITETTEL